MLCSKSFGPAVTVLLQLVIVFDENIVVTNILLEAGIDKRPCDKLLACVAASANAFIFTDNLRKLSLTAMLKRSEKISKLSDNRRNKRRYHRYQWLPIVSLSRSDL